MSNKRLVNQKRVDKRLAELRRRVRILRDYQQLSEKQLTGEERAFNSCLHHLQIATQACIDIADHLVSALKLERPEEMVQLFIILAREGVLSKKLAQKMKSAAGFRNILVHDYIVVDPHKVYLFVQKDLDDFDQFAYEIVKFLEKEKS